MVRKRRSLAPVGLIMAGLFLLACAPARSGGRQPHQSGYTEMAVHLNLGGRDFWVELARSPAERRRGLMYRPPGNKERDQGMLFDSGYIRYQSFWMKNTPSPLAIGFFDRENRLIQVEALKPFDTTPVRSRKPGRYALEMPAGWFAFRGIEHGAKLSILDRRSTDKLPPDLFVPLRKKENTSK